MNEYSGNFIKYKKVDNNFNSSLVNNRKRMNYERWDLYVNPKGRVMVKKDAGFVKENWRVFMGQCLKESSY